ncbi:hypothetical protein ACA910_022052 [Epithemia clementina (nom. ined.)]
MNDITAFDGRSATVQDMLRRLMAPRFIKSNPKLILDVDNHNRPNAPFLEFYFTDGSSYIVNPAVEMTAMDILLNVHTKAEAVDFEAELAAGVDPPIDPQDYLPGGTKK